MPIAHGRRELGGVLTQAAIMAGLSDGRESNPVKRGAWLARRIIAEPPDDPPPNVPALEDDTQHLRCASGSSGIATKPAAPMPLEDRSLGTPLRGVRRRRAAEAEPVDARSTLPDKTEVAGAERSEAVSGRRSHRSGGLQRAQAPGDLRDRPHPDATTSSSF